MQLKTMDFMTDEIMEKLIDEVSDFSSDAWSSMSMHLNLNSILLRRVCSRGVPPIEMFRELYKLMREQKVPIENYALAVQNECPAALCRTTHQDYIVPSVLEVDYTCRVPKNVVSTSPASKIVVITPVSQPKATVSSSDKENQRTFAPFAVSELLNMANELSSEGIIVLTFMNIVIPRFFNSFYASVVGYENKSSLHQLLDFLSFCRKQDMLLSHYRWLVKQFWVGDKILHKPTHEKYFNKIVAVRPPFVKEVYV